MKRNLSLIFIALVLSLSTLNAQLIGEKGAIARPAIKDNYYKSRSAIIGSFEEKKDKAGNINEVTYCFKESWVDDEPIRDRFNKPMIYNGNNWGLLNGKTATGCIHFHFVTDKLHRIIYEYSGVSLNELQKGYEENALWIKVNDFYFLIFKEKLPDYYYTIYNDTKLNAPVMEKHTDMSKVSKEIELYKEYREIRAKKWDLKELDMDLVAKIDAFYRPIIFEKIKKSTIGFKSSNSSAVFDIIESVNLNRSRGIGVKDGEFSSEFFKEDPLIKHKGQTVDWTYNIKTKAKKYRFAPGGGYKISKTGEVEFVEYSSDVKVEVPQEIKDALIQEIKKKAISGKSVRGNCSIDYFQIEGDNKWNISEFFVN